MPKTKTLERVKIRKPLPIYGAETLPVGAQITVTGEWETIPPYVKCAVILDPAGDRRLVVEDDLNYALGAH